jgi:hypothetical protein
MGGYLARVRSTRAVESAPIQMFTGYFRSRSTSALELVAPEGFGGSTCRASTRNLEVGGIVRGRSDRFWKDDQKD